MKRNGSFYRTTPPPARARAAPTSRHRTGGEAAKGREKWGKEGGRERSIELFDFSKLTEERKAFQMGIRSKTNSK